VYLNKKNIPVFKYKIIHIFNMARIMIADDSEAIRMVLKDILQVGNHQLVAEAKDGVEAVEKFDKETPDLLLLDFAMPRKDGKSALKEIIAKNPQAKVIMITASDNLDTINQCMKIGSSAFLLKPFDFDNVLNVITEVLTLEKLQISRQFTSAEIGIN
jgi:two-component system, chemotaxis family, chemotaxis protein CheY